MLTIHGRKHAGCCDGITRRDVLRIGAFGLGTLALPDLLRMEAMAGQAAAHSSKALINIYLGGGPPQMDMFDLKPDAPAGIRGEFRPIKTNVSGMEICELMPRMAEVADKYTIIRSVVGTIEKHGFVHVQSGFDEDELKAVGGHPSLGSVVSKLQGARNGAPPFVSTIGAVSPGFLGPSHAPFIPEGPGRQNLTLTRMKPDRIQSRTELLATLDDLRRDVDSSGAMEAMDSFTRRAVEVVTSGRVADALNIDKERPEIRARYYGGRTLDSTHQSAAEQLLLARRLIEAGVRVVSVGLFGWDTHQGNFATLRAQLPTLDGAVAALLRDLDERGLNRDVTVVMWGEFGRTPQINPNAGRDHWSRVMQAVVAGGGMKMGQVIGSTDRMAGEATSRPVHLREVFATLYHNLGIDAKNTTLIDPAGRPQYLVDGYDPIKELVG
jgi:hypothetical protein